MSSLAPDQQRLLDTIAQELRFPKVEPFALRRLLRAGVDPNFGFDTVDSNPLALALPITLGLPNQSDEEKQRDLKRRTIMALLLEYDANFLLGDPHWRGQTFFSSSRLAAMMIGHLAKLENNGNLMRGQQGDNPLHALAYEHAEILSVMTHFNSKDEELATLLKAMPVPLNLPPVWLNEQRHLDGATPLHVLWQKAEQNHTPQEVWHATITLIANGAKFDLKDHQGMNAAQMISLQVANGFEVPEEVASGWAAIESWLLHSQTQGANGEASKPMRL